MKGRGDRSVRVAEMIREEVSLILQNKVKDPGMGLVTVTDVTVTPDLKTARVHYSVLGGDQELEVSPLGEFVGRARREVREGYREVERERREARREIRREIREDYYDNYYRGDNRWYRDGRYWDRYEYERRYYRRRDRDDNDDMLKGALVGAAVVGVAVAIANSNDD